ncbi:MAG: transglycosylase SLT domain-containing protein [Candidatus Sericytochromatia bacterium]|nr:transglycosylase SLT domain-containing protein [Candidatus Tanganyikabacteria bacterium]
MAQNTLGDGSRWREIYELNKDQIKNPDLIHPGQVFKLPGDAKGSTGSLGQPSNIALADGTPPPRDGAAQIGDGPLPGGTGVGRWKELIDRAAAATGVPARLIAAVMQAESGGDPNAGSSAGAQGLMQLMPATARGLGVTNIRDPWQNLLGGAKYLRQQLDAFGWDVRKALAAYNAGPGAVQKYGGVPPYAETQNYVRKITTALA